MVSQYKTIARYEDAEAWKISLKKSGITFSDEAIQETAAAALPSVPQEDPGEDSYATLKPQKSSKKKPMLESVD